MSSQLSPCLFVPHGGGPLPLYDVPYQKDIGQFLKTTARKALIEDTLPEAIIVVTAHWESEDEIRISSASRHDLLYDYNFPNYPEAYKLNYNAPGHPSLARKIQEKLHEKGINSILDEKRGWDHGTFIPMILINPDADIPIIQVSILANQRAEDHWNLGMVLSQFRSDKIAILGSGMTYHNMQKLRNPPNTDKVVNEEFDMFLDKVIKCDASERKRLLLSWEEREGALDSHPVGGADHFMPFIVTAAAGGASRCEKIFTTDFKINFRLSAYLWK